MFLPLLLDTGLDHKEPLLYELAGSRKAFGLQPRTADSPVSTEFSFVAHLVSSKKARGLTQQP
jgi:hypothetical protein